MTDKKARDLATNLYAVCNNWEAVAVALCTVVFELQTELHTAAQKRAKPRRAGRPRKRRFGLLHVPKKPRGRPSHRNFEFAVAKAVREYIIRNPGTPFRQALRQFGVWRKLTAEETRCVEKMVSKMRSNSKAAPTDPAARPTTKTSFDAEALVSAWASAKP